MDQTELDRITARLRRQGTDDGQVEVKASASKLSSDVWDSVSAFANTAGGLIILGLSEPNGFAPVADFALDRVLDQFVDGIGAGNPDGVRLVNPPEFQLNRHQVDGQPVLAVTITENQVGTKPCYVKAKGVATGSYKRVDDKDIRLSSTEIYELRNQFRASVADRASVPAASLADLRPDLVQALFDSPRSTKALKGVEGELASLRSLNVLDSNDEVRLAALLTLGRYPQQFFPRLLVDVTVHPTTEKSSPSQPLRFVDRVECEGPLADIVDEAFGVMRRNLRTHTIVEGAGRKDLLEIPEGVLREAITNAVLHREYDSQFVGQPVAVDVYPDRIEVTSPGGLWGGKTLSTLADGISRCRNQTLLQALERVPLSSGEGTVAEGQGSGVPLMNRLMAARALDLPDYRSTTPDLVRVVLRRHGAEVPELRGWLADRLHGTLGPDEETALLVAQREGRVTVVGLRTTLGRDSDDVRAMLGDLERKGALHQSGEDAFILGDHLDAPQGLDLLVLDALSPTTPLTIHEISDETGRTVNALRPVLRRLARSGRALATAPPTSRQRRYLRAQ